MHGTSQLELLEDSLKDYESQLNLLALRQVRYFLLGVISTDLRPYRDELNLRLASIAKKEFNYHLYRSVCAFGLLQFAVDHPSESAQLEGILQDSVSWLLDTATKSVRRHNLAPSLSAEDKTELAKDLASNILLGDGLNRRGLLRKKVFPFYELNSKAFTWKLASLHNAVLWECRGFLRKRNPKIYGKRASTVRLGLAVDHEGNAITDDLPDKAAVSGEKTLLREGQARELEQQGFGIIANAWRIDPEIVNEALDDVINSKRGGKGGGADILVRMIRKANGVKEEAARMQFKRQALEIRDALLKITSGRSFEQLKEERKNESIFIVKAR